MTGAINIEFNETQAKRFEHLLDDFNETMHRLENNEVTRQTKLIKLDTEIELLLSQAERDLKNLEQSRLNQRKMLWEN